MPVPVPVRFTELVGKVMVWLLPALAVGGRLIAGFTVTTTLALPLNPRLSVADSEKTYTPCTRPLMVVLAAVGVTIAAADGPLV